jgi:hypothetical protein
MHECENCLLKYSITNNGLCIFCKIIKKNSKEQIYNFIICKSVLTQEEIIKKTYDLFIKNDIIPSPKQIDNSAIKININPYLFYKYIKNDKYKIFFTNCIDRNQIKIKRLGSQYNLEKLNIDKFCVGKDLKNIDEKTYNEYLTKLNI